MDFKKCMVIGAGNAGRPVARLLNHVGIDVTMSDPKTLDQFTQRNQNIINIMENEGVKLDLGTKIPDIDSFDAIYFSPSIPESAPISKIVKNSDKINVDMELISNIVNDILTMPKIGITGSYGKTSTTTMLKFIFKAAGYNVYDCSSMKGNLVVESIVDDIVTGSYKESDIAILELPHGTLGLLGDVKLDIGILLNLHPEHLTEFGGSMEKYVDRKGRFLTQSKKLIASTQCGDLLTYKRDDTIYYSLKENIEKYPKYTPKYIGNVEDEQYSIEYDNEQHDVDIDTITYYIYENATGVIAAVLEYGLTIDDVKKGLELFKGVEGRMEYLGQFNHIKVFYDSSYGDDGVRQSLKSIKDENLTIIYDNLDTTTIRDKQESGRVISEYANILIATGYIEITDELNMDSALELLNAADNPSILKIAVCTIEEAAELAIKYSKPGDIIVHLGPGTGNSYQIIKDKLLKGLECGVKRYANKNN